MRFYKGVRNRLENIGLSSDDVALTLERFEGAVPHLRFESWRGVSRDPEIETSGEVLWKPSQEVQVDINLGRYAFSLRVKCRRCVPGPIGVDDYAFMLSLAREAAQMLDSELGPAMSLLDFGTFAVADEIERIGGSEAGVLPVMRFIRSLGQESYENQKLTYGLIFSNAYEGDEPLAKGFSNKRLKRLTDGFSTALIVDGVGNLSGYTALSTPLNEGQLLTRRPWWSAGLAVASKKLDGVGVALLRNGDIIVLKQGKLLFAHRAGLWQIWNHTAIVASLRAAWNGRGARGQVNRVLHYLYHIALDLSFRRSGGLLIVLEKAASLKHLLVSMTDSVNGPTRGVTERSLDKLLGNYRVQSLDRRIATDIASLDGGVVVDRQGNVLAYGAMTRAAGGAKQGARTRAAVRASAHGIVIKVSSDGQISFFSKGRSFLEL